MDLALTPTGFTVGVGRHVCLWTGSNYTTCGPGLRLQKVTPLAPFAPISGRHNPVLYLDGVSIHFGSNHEPCVSSVSLLSRYMRPEGPPIYL